jgi:hypothetical protein
MRHPLLLLLAAVAVLAATTPAHAAAKKSCTSGGARILASDGGLSVVSITPKERHGDQPQDIVYGCANASGKRFKLFSAFLDEESDTWSLLGGRYIGVFREISEGVSGQSFGTTWDASKHRALYETKSCDNVQIDPSSDENPSGPDVVVFFRGGGMAYSCINSFIVDAKGNRPLEPAGTAVTGLAVTPDGGRLYYLVGDVAKSMTV